MYPRLKILFTSGYTDDEILKGGNLEPGRSFIQKPFTPEMLLRAARGMLDAAAIR